MEKDWQEVKPGEKATFVVDPPKVALRTKEQFIEEQEAMRAGKRDPYPVGAILLALGRSVDASAVNRLATAVAEQWATTTLRNFDLRRLDEQGRFIADGGMLTRCDQKLSWKAGTHFDEVLELGLQGVESKFIENLDSYLMGRNQPATGPRPAASDDDISWEDLGEWLESLGFGLKREDDGFRSAKRGDSAYCWGSRAASPRYSDLDMLTGELEMSVRAIRVAVLAYVRKPKTYGTPLLRPLPQTREEFAAALGLETGRSYSGLRERIAEWMNLPLTEEQSLAEAEVARTLNTGLCRACRDRQETCARCGSRAEKTEIGPTMFAAPGEDGRTYSAPICRACLNRGDLDKMTIRDGRIVPKAVEVSPLPIAGPNYTFGNFCRRIEREVAEQFRLPAEASTSSSPDTEGRFYRKLVLEPARDAAASEHDRALIEAGYDPRAMTAAQLVEAHGRGLLPGLLPGANLQIVDGKVAVVEP